jgi:large subunit ribosomal protein L30
VPEQTLPPGPGRTLKLELVRSPIGSNARQRATVQALGLRKLHQVVIHTDSPATRGMVLKVAHLVRIIDDQQEETRRAPA